MGIAGKSQRVKRGFHRIGLLGLIPGLLGAIITLAYQYFEPTGGYQVAGATSIELEAGAELPVTPWALTKYGNFEYLESEKAKSAVEKAIRSTGTSLPLLDGRQVMVLTTGQDLLLNEAARMSLNRSIVTYEMRSQRPISYYEGPYSVGSTWVQCKSYSECDAPFPVARHSHISRKSEYLLATIPLALGFVWFLLTWVVSWIIRGFMSD